MSSKYEKHTRSAEGAPLVSIITVVFNGEKHLEQTIQSVLCQSYQNIEYIVVDGGSSDGTVDIIERYADQIAYWVSEPDDGVYDAMNKGIRQANGKYVGLINSDDWYEKDAVETVVSTFEANDSDVIYGDKRIIREDGSSRIYRPKSAALDSDFDLNYVHPTIFVSKNIYEKRQYSSKYDVSADLEFLLALAAGGAKMVHVGSVIANMRTEGLSGTSRGRRRGRREGFYIRRMYLGRWAATKGFTKALVLAAAVRLMGPRIRRLLAQMHLRP
ncbi:glycosyltransferase family 2 protein [Thioalkalivibrio sp. AKL7]|uniref:glycosyltransferase family 2 protein n=1 Tax=Thioalkalivibrio sp. AKL7 TaxID=1158155 RepID=UPI0009DB0D8B|nr:glycosyltransferase family 2 protein [Thioalkalivibrio sp. AKL7]